jgi:hypothetical protein
MLLRLSGVRSRMGVGSEDAAAVGKGRIIYSVLREAAAMPLDAILLAVQRAWRGMGGPRH